MRKMLILVILTSVFAMSACEKIEFEEPRKVSRIACDDSCVCDKLNGNVQFISALVRAFEGNAAVTSFSTRYISGQSDTYTFTFSGKETVRYNNVDDHKGVPALSIYRNGNQYYWSVNGHAITDQSGRALSTSNDTIVPMFAVNDSVWTYTVDNRIWQPVPASAKAQSPANAELSPSKDFLVFTANDSLQLVVPTNYLKYTLVRNVPLGGFYKDIFLDAGVYLTTRTSLAAATHINYSLESVSCSAVADTAWQNTVLGGSLEDLNGRLLYPDGQPRYKLLFVCGGKSTKHGQSLRPECRDNMRAFVGNGGSYVGTCAGAFFATSGDEVYLHLWPGIAKQTGLKQTNTGFFIDIDSPLLRYYTFGGDNYVANIRHNGGCYALDWPAGTELLARYDYPAIPEMHEKPAAWAYKENPSTGRVIMEGSHPEEVSSGERRDFTAAMLRYAADGVGATPLKGLLRNGEPRVMDKATPDHDPLHTMIGDMQYHHFAVYIPSGAKNIVFDVATPTDCNIQLCLSDKTYAYSDKAAYMSPATGASQSLGFENLHEGIWYVSVRQLTTVTATDFEKGQTYSGRTDVLNGVPYTLSVTWKP